MKKHYKIIIAGGVVMACYPLLLQAETCGSLPNCPNLGFTVPQSDLSTTCKDKTYLKCPFGDYYFCSAVDDGCPTFVTVDPSTEVCTQYCPKNSSKCLTKRTISCSEAVSKANGTLVTPTSGGVCGTITRNLYLTGPVKGNCTYQTPEYIQMSVYSADTLAPCRSEMKGEASLEMSSLRIKNSATFNVKTKINYIYFSNYEGSITFGADADIRNIEGYAQTSWIRTISIYVHGDYGKPTQAKIGLSCGGDCSSSSSWYPPTCNFQINGHYSQVTYGNTYYSGGGGGCQAEVSCSGYSGDFTCTKSDYMY